MMTIGLMKLKLDGGRSPYRLLCIYYLSFDYLCSHCDQPVL
jgi:hypothetical protein